MLFIVTMKFGAFFSLHMHKINGLVNDSHQSLTLRRRTRGIYVLHHETTPIKQGQRLLQNYSPIE